MLFRHRPSCWKSFTADMYNTSNFPSSAPCHEDIPRDISFQLLHCVERCEHDASCAEPSSETVVWTNSWKVTVSILCFMSDYISCLCYLFGMIIRSWAGAVEDLISLREKHGCPSMGTSRTSLAFAWQYSSRLRSCSLLEDGSALVHWFSHEMSWYGSQHCFRVAPFRASSNRFGIDN